MSIIVWINVFRNKGTGIRLPCDVRYSITMCRRLISGTRRALLMRPIPLAYTGTHCMYKIALVVVHYKHDILSRTFAKFVCWETLSTSVLKISDAPQWLSSWQVRFLMLEINVFVPRAWLIALCRFAIPLSETGNFQIRSVRLDCITVYPHWTRTCVSISHQNY